MENEHLSVNLALWNVAEIPACWYRRAGFPTDVSKPMNKSNPGNKEAVDRKLIEDIYQISKISLGEGAATCQVCGSSFHEGNTVAVYVFKPVEDITFQIGHVMCANGKHELPSEYTLGVRELVIEGRIGRCADVATQSSWQVLLEPGVLAVSAAATMTARRRPATESTVRAGSDRDAHDPPHSSVQPSVGAIHRRAGQTDDASPAGLWGEQR